MRRLVTTRPALGWQAYSRLVETETPNHTLGITAIVLLALAIQGLFARREPSPAPQT